MGTGVPTMVPAFMGSMPGAVPFPFMTVGSASSMPLGLRGTGSGGGGDGGGGRGGGGGAVSGLGAGAPGGTRWSVGGGDRAGLSTPTTGSSLGLGWHGSLVKDTRHEDGESRALKTHGDEAGDPSSLRVGVARRVDTQGRTMWTAVPTPATTTTTTTATDRAFSIDAAKSGSSSTSFGVDGGSSVSSGSGGGGGDGARRHSILSPPMTHPSGQFGTTVSARSGPLSLFPASAPHALASAVTPITTSDGVTRSVGGTPAQGTPPVESSDDPTTSEHEKPFAVESSAQLV